MKFLRHMQRNLAIPFFPKRFVLLVKLNNFACATKLVVQILKGFLSRILFRQHDVIERRGSYKRKASQKSSYSSSYTQIFPNLINIYKADTIDFSEEVSILGNVKPRTEKSLPVMEPDTNIVNKQCILKRTKHKYEGNDSGCVIEDDDEIMTSPSNLLDVAPSDVCVMSGDEGISEPVLLQRRFGRGNRNVLLSSFDSPSSGVGSKCSAGSCDKREKKSSYSESSMTYCPVMTPYGTTRRVSSVRHRRVESVSSTSKFSTSGSGSSSSTTGANIPISSPRSRSIFGRTHLSLYDLHNELHGSSLNSNNKSSQTYSYSGFGQNNRKSKKMNRSETVLPGCLSNSDEESEVSSASQTSRQTVASYGSDRYVKPRRSSTRKSSTRDSRRYVPPCLADTSSSLSRRPSSSFYSAQRSSSFTGFDLENAFQRAMYIAKDVSSW